MLPDSNFRCLSLDANSSDLSLERSKSLNKSLRVSCVIKLGLFSESCSSNEVSLLESIESLEDDRLLELAGGVGTGRSSECSTGFNADGTSG